MAAIVKVFAIGSGLRTVPFTAGKDGAWYLEQAGVSPGRGTIMVNNIAENGGTGAAQRIGPGDIVGVAPKAMKSGR